MNPFRLSPADTLTIGGATFLMGEVHQDGYLLRRAHDHLAEYHSNERLLELWTKGIVEPWFACLAPRGNDAPARSGESEE